LKEAKPERKQDWPRRTPCSTEGWK
jgi:hypothetical protein